MHDALGYLLRIAQDIEAGDPEVESELEYFELVPPSESVDFRETLKAGKAKKVQNTARKPEPRDRNYKKRK